MKLIMPIIFILAGIGSFVFFTNPRYQDLQEKLVEQREIAEANTQANRLRAERDRLTSERAKITLDEEKRLEKLLPNSVENVGLIIDIDNIAQRHGMVVRNSKVTEATTRSGSTIGPDSKKYGSISLSFSVTSDYVNFMNFIRDLEDSLRLVDVSSLSFSSARDNQYNFNITLQTYWLK
jgi:Tfp pilus assembly protein PilO